MRKVIHPLKMLRRLSAKDRRGFSLITVASLGTVVMMWLMAISASVLPMYNRSAQSRYTTVVRSAAEASLDYAVNALRLSISDEGEVTSPLDDGLWHDVPALVLTPDANQLGQITAKVKIDNVSPPTTSSIYNDKYDISGGPNPSGVAIQGWRLVTATAEYAMQTKTIRVILEPTFGEQITVPSTTNVPFFQHTLFGQSYVWMEGNASTDAYDSRTGHYGVNGNVDNVKASIATNGSPAPSSKAPISLEGNNVIGGDVTVFSSGTMGHDAIGSGSGVTINDQLIVNGDAPDFFNPDNVLGMDTAPGDPTIVKSAGLEPMSIPAAQSPPANASVVSPTMAYSGDTVTVGAPGPNQVVNLGTVALDGQTVMQIPAGDYLLSSLSIAGKAQIVTQGSGVTRFFIQGNAAGDNAIQIAGNGIANSSGIPGNLQVWYGGSKGTYIAGNGNLRAVVYAPSSRVTIAGNGNIFGAVLGYSVTSTGNGMFHFDKALAEGDNQWNLSYKVVENKPYMPLNGLRTISWQELR